MKPSETPFAVQQRQRTERNISAVQRAHQQWRRQEPVLNLRRRLRQEEDRGSDWPRGPSRTPLYRPS